MALVVFTFIKLVVCASILNLHASILGDNPLMFTLKQIVLM